jgi:hypothetical protein
MKALIEGLSDGERERGFYAEVYNEPFNLKKNNFFV